MVVMLKELDKGTNYTHLENLVAKSSLFVSQKKKKKRSFFYFLFFIFIKAKSAHLYIRNYKCTHYACKHYGAKVFFNLYNIVFDNEKIELFFLKF